MKFRSDINGLRAYAVIFVVLFHFGIPPFNGGFVGVDVFFVISGYLMTRIIVEGIGVGKFSILKFYLARCKRIIPPLIVLCVILLIVGYFIIPPAEYATLSKHILTSVTFTSNMMYYREAGYFDVGSSYKWLLHTWSLSVEWQFYLVLPIFLIAVSSWLKGKYKLSLIVSFLASFALALVLSKKDPSLSYFFFGSRAWEMIAGGLAYTYSVKNISSQTKRAVTYLNVLVLVVSAVMINDSVAWPGVLTLIPVTATAIIIAITGDGWILENKVVQKIGLWSYSIYLYHWPLLVASGIYFTDKNIFVGMILTVISIIMGWFSYRFVEDKSGRIFAWFSKPVALFPSALALVVIGGFLFKTGGLPSHAPERVNQISSYAEDSNHAAKACFVIDSLISPECKFGPKKENSEVDLVVIGDSHAYATLSSVIESNPQASVVFIAQSGCPAVPGVNQVSRPNCGQFMTNAFDSAKSKYKNASILIVSSFSQYIHGKNGTKFKEARYSFNGEPGTLSSFMSHLNESIKGLGDERNVFILSPIPDFSYDVVFRMSRNAMLGMNAEIKESMFAYKKRSDDILSSLNAMANESKNIKILDVTDYLCSENECYGSKNGIPLYRDNNHLSETGNKVLTPLFSQIWR